MIGKEKLKLLVVDDDPDVVDMLSAYLSGHDMEITTAENGAEALKRLKEKEFELVISDVMMPEMNGIELLKRMSSEHPDVAIIMLTSMDETKLATQAMQSGAFDYILKPVEFSQLNISISNAVTKQRLIQENRAYKETLERMVKEQRDVIQQQRSQLLQSDKLSSLGMLISGVCHEINNPLAFINSNLQLLELYFGNLKNAMDEYAREHPDYRLKKMTMEEAAQNIKRMLDDSLQGANSIKGIVSDIMGFSRKESDERRAFCVNDCIRKTLHMARFILKNKVAVQAGFGPDPLEALGQPQKMGQVFMNLFHNAAYAMRDRPASTLTITTRKEPISGGHGERIFIEVKDNGAGIPKEVMERIFDPYFTTKPSGEGTGLGLSISRNIVEDHGGAMSVESELNKGASFIITLPVHKD
ncbi:MAG: response regulator [Nitrospinae bacterium]|nr:response regulator [Nitrospinota bacterium]